VQAHRAKDDFEKRETQVVIVGHSSLRYGRAFVEETGVTFPVFVDEKRATFKALGFRRPLLGVLSPGVFKNAARARAAGFSQPGVHGDAFQLGGVVLVKPDGTMPYFYASKAAGDHPPIDDLLRAAE
jgi:hypothetical protein